MTRLGPALTVVAVLMAGSAEAQTHPHPTEPVPAPGSVVPASAPAPPPAAAPETVRQEKAPEAPASKATAPVASGSSAQPVAATTVPASQPVKLSEVRGRINAALSANAPATPAARRRRAPARAGVVPAVPRYELRWPAQRWQVQWAPPIERLTLVWPQP